MLLRNFLPPDRFGVQALHVLSNASQRALFGDIHLFHDLPFRPGLKALPYAVAT
jgi:hypothetical protein